MSSIGSQGLNHRNSNLVDVVGVINSTYPNMSPSSQFSLNTLGVIDSSELLVKGESSPVKYVDTYKYLSCDELPVPVSQSEASNSYIHKTNNNYSDIAISYNSEITLNPYDPVYLLILDKANRSNSPMVLYDSTNSIEGSSLYVPNQDQDVLASISLDYNSNLYKLRLYNRGSVQRKVKLNTGDLSLRIDNSYFPFVDPSSLVVPYRPNYVDSTTWGDYRLEGGGDYSGMYVSMDQYNSILLELCAGGGGGAQNSLYGDATGSAGGGAGGYMCIYIQQLSSLGYLKITVGKAGKSEYAFNNQDSTQGEQTSLDLVVDDKSFRLFACEGGYNAASVRNNQNNTFQRGGVGGRVAYGSNNTFAYNESNNNNKPSNNSSFPREGCILYNSSTETIRIITASMDKIDDEVPVLRFKVLSVIYGGSGGSYMTRGQLIDQGYKYIKGTSSQYAATNGSFAGCRFVQASGCYTWEDRESGSSYNNSISNYNILSDLFGVSISNQLARCEGSTQYLFNNGTTQRCYCAGGGASALSYVTYVPYSSSSSDTYQNNNGNSTTNYSKYVRSNGYGYGGGGGYYSRSGNTYTGMRSDPGSGVAILHYPGSRFSFRELSEPSNISIEQF